MKNLKKKAVLLMMTTSLAAGTLSGCGSIKNTDTAATIEGDTMEAGVANFYARYQQAMIETNLKAMLGDTMWTQEIGEGKTYEDNVKDSVMESLKQFYILEDHMEEYGVSLSDEEKAKIEKTAQKFDEENPLESKKLISAEKQYVERVLTLFTIQNKMWDAMTKDVDTVVDDKQAAQKKMQYVSFPFAKDDESEASKTALKEKASQFLEGAKSAEDIKAYAESAGYTVSDMTFDAETTSPDAELIKAADALAEGAWTEVIETESGFYVAKVTSLLDREATDKKKESIVNERKNEKFTEIYEGWKKDAKVKVNKDVWDKIDFQKVGVTVKQPETEEK